MRGGGQGEEEATLHPTPSWARAGSDVEDARWRTRCWWGHRRVQVWVGGPEARAGAGGKESRRCVTNTQGATSFFNG